MKNLRRLLSKWLNLFRNDRAEAELEREIHAHLRLLEDEFLATGMSAEQARLAAGRAYGGVEQANRGTVKTVQFCGSNISRGTSGMRSVGSPGFPALPLR